MGYTGSLCVTFVGAQFCGETPGGDLIDFRIFTTVSIGTNNACDDIGCEDSQMAMMGMEGPGGFVLTGLAGLDTLMS